MMFSNNIDYWDLKEDSDYILHHYAGYRPELRFQYRKNAVPIKELRFLFTFSFALVSFAASSSSSQHVQPFAFAKTQLA